MSKFESEQDCSICTEICTKDLLDSFKTPCNHIFHKECLVGWLESCKSPTCPNCRTDIESMYEISGAKKPQRNCNCALHMANIDNFRRLLSNIITVHQIIEQSIEEDIIEEPSESYVTLEIEEFDENEGDYS